MDARTIREKIQEAETKAKEDSMIVTETIAPRVSTRAIEIDIFPTPSAGEAKESKSLDYLKRFEAKICIPQADGSEQKISIPVGTERGTRFPVWRRRIKGSYHEDEWGYRCTGVRHIADDRSSLAFMVERKHSHTEATPQHCQKERVCNYCVTTVTKHYDLMVVRLDDGKPKLLPPLSLCKPITSTESFFESKYQKYHRAALLNESDDDRPPNDLQYLKNYPSRIFLQGGSSGDNWVQIFPEHLSLNHWNYYPGNVRLHGSYCQQYFANDFSDLFLYKTQNSDVLPIMKRADSLCAFVPGSFVYTRPIDYKILSLDLETFEVAQATLSARFKSLTSDSEGNLHFVGDTDKETEQKSVYITLRSIETRLAKRTPPSFVAHLALNDALPTFSIALNVLIAEFLGSIPKFSCKFFSAKNDFDILGPAFEKEFSPEEQQRFTELFKQTSNSGKDLLLNILRDVNKTEILTVLDKVLKNEYLDLPIKTLLQEVKASRVRDVLPGFGIL